jgi:Sec-independent protein translocase protein TatA
MNGDMMKYAYWIILAVLLIVLIFSVPNIFGEVFKAIGGVFSAIFKSANDIKDGLSESPLLNNDTENITIETQ